MTFKQDKRKQYNLRLTFFKGRLWFNVYNYRGRLQVDLGFRVGKEW